MPTCTLPKLTLLPERLTAGAGGGAELPFALMM